jgi:anti-sigma factor RsiW
MMKCDGIRDQLADYVVGGLAGRKRRRVEQHLRECAACRAEVAALERTGALLESLEAQDAPRQTWETVRRDIAARQQQRVRPRWAWGMAMGVMALVLVVVGGLILGPIQMGAPPVVVAAEADEELEATIEGHLSAVWAAPLADEAAIGLRLAALEDNG